MRAANHVGRYVAVALAAAWLGRPLPAGESSRPAEGPFGYTLVRTADGEPAEIDFFFLNQDCAVCHPRQLEEVQGALHSSAHTDPLYRNLAVIARQEAGEKVYTYCSGCHSPEGVVSTLIPNTPEEELPAEAKAGITCDVCHQISQLTGAEGPWGEPGNASFVLQPGRVKFGHTGQVSENRSHLGEKKDFFAKSEFCASCHTVIHPLNGLRIENTYGEWKSSVYAEKGIQCQDCHMRSVEDAQTVAATLKPVSVRGQSVVEGVEREIFPHFFVGGNANADQLADGPRHARMAEARLQSAARVELQVPAQAAAGGPLPIDVLVHNVAAGHNLPTGVTELRQMWVELQVIDSQGKVLFHRGGLDGSGELTDDTIRFGAIAGNPDGQATYKPWEMQQFLWKRTVPPKGFTRDKVLATLPADLVGQISVEAKLRYRSVAPHIVREILPDASFEPKIVEMCSHSIEVRLQ